MFDELRKRIEELDRCELPYGFFKTDEIKPVLAAFDALVGALNLSKPNPNTLAWYAEKRPLFHATYNGGHHDDKCREAFHHGMDTVFNALEGDAKKMIALAEQDTRDEAIAAILGTKGENNG